jgi:hypothetical protein
VIWVSIEIRIMGKMRGIWSGQQSELADLSWRLEGTKYKRIMGDFYLNQTSSFKCLG